jgi:cephalosporin hydroxylase
MNQLEKFDQDCRFEIAEMEQNSRLLEQSQDWMNVANTVKYSYHFSWLGRPIIQYPQDIVAMQELIWTVKPDLIIETGIAHGGSLIFSASMMALLDMCEAAKKGTSFDPRKSSRHVLGIDIDIRKHNLEAIKAHPMESRISMIQGSSIETSVINEVRGFAQKFSRVLVCLDSNHTHEHVLAELQAYASLTSVGSYCVVFDTVIEDMPNSMFPDRPWGPGNNPKTAVRTFLLDHPEFVVDTSIPAKLQLTVAPDGYLRRTG